MNALEFLKRPEFKPGLTLILADEPVVVQWLLAEFRGHFAKQGFERNRISGSSEAAWHEALTSFDHLSLFATQTFTELHMSSAHKPKAADLQLLEQFMKQPQGNALVVVFPAQDYKGLKAKLFSSVQSGGVLIHTQSNNQNTLSLLKHHAASLGVDLDQEAWQLLLAQTQNNLTAAASALLRVEALGAETTLSAQNLLDALEPDSKFSISELMQACLSGNAALAVKIMRHLQEVKESEVLLLWNLNQALTKITQLQFGVAASSLNLWPRQLAPLYAKTAARLSLEQLSQVQRLAQISDEKTKGLTPGSAWLSLTEMVATLAGAKLCVTQAAEPTH